MTHPTLRTPHTRRVTFPEDAAALRDLPFTYSERGWTAWNTPPAGYQAVQRSGGLGTGADRFDRAAEALMRWQMHRQAGLRLITTDRVAVVGARVLLTIGVGRLAVRAPCQVVYTVHEPTRRGFAYGTLTGHPVSGEEAFIVSLDPDTGRVTFTVRAFSRPATPLARLGGPFTPLAQQLGITRYLSTMAALAQPEPRA